MDGVQQANSGHPGLPMGAAAMGYAVWARHLKHNPKNPDWFDRDRFVLSAGHGSMLLYSLLHLTGYDVSLDDLKAFRQWGSRTPGHPENTLTPGVEMATGPLGQGLSTAVGMAIAERHLAASYNKPGFDLIGHFTYVICSDGDLMEGVTNEACSLAGHLRLGKLIALYDDNGITIDGSTKIAFTEDVPARFAALGWHTQTVDGMDVDAVDRAIQAARAHTDAPSLIACKTTIGFGSPNKAGTSKVHGAPLGAEEVDLAKQRLGIPLEPKFLVPDAVREAMGKAVACGAAAEAAWKERLSAYRSAYPEEAMRLDRALAGELPADLAERLPKFEKPTSTRVAGSETLQVLAQEVPYLVGGSADLAESNLTHLKGIPEFQPETPEGRNIAFGIREHAMGCIVNGINRHGGLRAYGASFLVFSDYCRPAIRLAALMHCPSIFVFTHDSIGLGEDGPTHQPVEHLMSLRAIPNLNVMRPADAAETAACWQLALERKDGPSLLALTRQNLPVITERGDQVLGLSGPQESGHEHQTTRKPENLLSPPEHPSSSHPARLGGYILNEASSGSPKVILVATGSETSVALQARDILEAEGIATRVVNLPSAFLFERQSAGYRASVLPDRGRTVSVEAGVTLGWERYATAHVGLDHFGASAPGPKLMEEFGFTAQHVAEVGRRVAVDG
ncbi:MAG: transketolase [Armatimonadetes bacterium]|nr:transketolase [Armatimonadota bacterium]